MAYKDRYGSTIIRGDRRDNVSIGWDYDDDEADKSQRYASILYIPDTQDSEHSHINLTREQALVLRNWLIDFLNDTGPVDFQHEENCAWMDHPARPCTCGARREPQPDPPRPDRKPRQKGKKR